MFGLMFFLNWRHHCRSVASQSDRIAIQATVPLGRQASNYNSYTQFIELAAFDKNKYKRFGKNNCC